MDLKLFKEIYLLRPLQTIVIDRSCDLGDDQIHLLALTYKDKSYSLWTLNCLSNEIDVSNLTHNPATETKRESLNRNRMPDVRSIESLQIEEYSFMFDGSSSELFIHHGNPGYNKLQYFLELGIELSHWDNIPLSRLQLTEHRYSGTMPMVDIELHKKPIILKFRSYQKKAEVFQKFSVDFDIDEPVELNYFNPFEDTDESFYVYGFETYSLDKYMQSIKNNDKYKDVPREHIDGMIERLTNYFEHLKQKNASLVLMTYEADRGLLFQSTEYLDRKMEFSPNSSSETMAFIFKPEQNIGIHGKRMFITSFQDIPNDKIDTIEFELHSVSKQFQGTTIII